MFVAMTVATNASGAGTISGLARVTGWLTLLLGAAAIGLGLLISWREAEKANALKHAAKQKVDAMAPAEFKLAATDVLKDATGLTTALAKVDPGTRVLIIGVVLLALSAATSGTGEISTAIAKHGKGHNVTIINKPGGTAKSTAKPRSSP